MEQLTTLAIVLLVLTVSLIAIAVWSPRMFWVKACALALGVSVMILGYISMASLLGLPRPTTLEWVNENAKEAIVLGSKVKKGEGIYLLLELRGAKEPIYYKMPWNLRAAERLEDADREAKRRGTKLMMKGPFKRSLGPPDELFYPAPQPAPPLKDTERGPGPRIYNPQEL